MFFPTNDPILDHYRYEDEREKELRRMPRCSECNNPIQEDILFEWNGKLICPECTMTNHRKYTEDYME